MTTSCVVRALTCCGLLRGWITGCIRSRREGRQRRRRCRHKVRGDHGEPGLTSSSEHDANPGANALRCLSFAPSGLRYHLEHAGVLAECLAWQSDNRLVDVCTKLRYSASSRTAVPGCRGRGRQPGFRGLGMLAQLPDGLAPQTQHPSGLAGEHRGFDDATPPVQQVSLSDPLSGRSRCRGHQRSPRVPQAIVMIIEPTITRRENPLGGHNRLAVSQSLTRGFLPEPLRHSLGTVGCPKLVQDMGDVRLHRTF